MKWKERMGLALSGALIGLTLLLIVDVHYRISNGQLTPPGEGGGGSSAANTELTGGDVSAQQRLQQAAPIGGSSKGNAGPQTVVDGGGEVGRSPSPLVGGDTAENQNANSKLTNNARLVVRNQRDDGGIIMKHDKVQYVQPNNLSQIVIK